jgi:two-component system, OmpR family, alkaline phosphatase synthesis response regulator PhoP
MEMNQSVNKILVVDDEADIIELLQYNLEKEGYEVATANDGKQAIEKAKTFMPEVVLMDIMMPVMDGVEAARQLRQNPDLKDTYILFLTARSEEYSEIAAFEAGADDYITKPIKPKSQNKQINSLLAT